MIFESRRIMGMAVEVVTAAELEKLVVVDESGDEPCKKVHYDYLEFIESINQLIQEHATNLDAMPELIGFDLSPEYNMSNDDSLFPVGKLDGNCDISHRDMSIEWFTWAAWPVFKMWTEPTINHGPTLIYEIVRR